MEQKKFVGLSIAGWLFIISAIPAGIVSFIAMISGGPLVLHMRIPAILSPVFFIVSAAGIILKEKWGRLFAVIVSSITAICLTYIAIQSIRILSEHPEWTAANISFARTLIVITIPFIWVIFYFTRPKVKEYFKK